MLDYRFTESKNTSIQTKAYFLLKPTVYCCQHMKGNYISECKKVVIIYDAQLSLVIPKCSLIYWFSTHTFLNYFVNIILPLELL